MNSSLVTGVVLKNRHSKHSMNNSLVRERTNVSKGPMRETTRKLSLSYWKKHMTFTLCIFLVFAVTLVSFRLYRGSSSVVQVGTTDLDESTGWEALSNRVAFAIKTGEQVIEERFPNPNNTWLQRVSNYMVVSDVANTRYQAVGLKELFETAGFSLESFLETRQAPLLQSSEKRPFKVTVDQTRSGWWQDREKNLPGFYMMWKKFPNMDWYIMCDDDTFFFLDGLAAILEHPIFQQAMKEELPIYMGNEFNVALCEGYDPSGMTNGTLNPWFAHGGSGIVLNYWALEALVEMIPWCMQRFQDCWAGDIKVGLCFRELGIDIVPMGTHFIAVDPKNYFDTYYSQPPYKQAKPHDIVASLHHCDDEEFEFLYSLPTKQHKQIVQFQDIAKYVSPSFQFP
jgi:hypothetical protein